MLTGSDPASPPAPATPVPAGPETPSLPSREVLAGFVRLSGGWWRGPSAWQAWRLSLTLGLFLVGNIGVNLAINQWNRAFFDGLERRDGGLLTLLIPAFGGLVVAVAGIGVLIVITRETLQVRWREWVVARLVAGWLADKSFYRLPLSGREPMNPEYRIADDSRMATEPVVDFVIGLTHAVLTAAAFIGVLWSVGGALTLSVAGTTVTIPAYLMLAAVVYGAGASLLMVRIGHPLIAGVARRNEAEAKFRFELTRVRENAESVAMIGGEAAEQRQLRATYGQVVERWLRVVGLHARLTWITNGSGALVPVIPLFLAMPKYLSGELSLGAVTQLAAAFVQVQVAIAWLVDNYKQIAQWHASAERLLALSRATQPDGKGSSGIVRSETDDGTILLRDLTISDRSGRGLLQSLNLEIAPGERILIMGESGLGKSTLLRALAGLWPWGRGHVALPRDARIGYGPQEPYLPLGTLRDALLYPGLDPAPSDERLAALLAECGLPQLRSRLDQVERWDRILSRGEVQRLAFARLLLHKPAVVILDEATSGLDEVSQGRLMLLLARDLHHATVISVGHRPSLRPFHGRCFALVRAEGGARLVEDGERPGSPETRSDPPALRAVSSFH